VVAPGAPARQARTGCRDGSGIWSVSSSSISGIRSRSASDGTQNAGLAPVDYEDGISFDDAIEAELQRMTAQH
jgi:hypothetical protein